MSVLERRCVELLCVLPMDVLQMSALRHRVERLHCGLLLLFPRYGLRLSLAPRCELRKDGLNVLHLLVRLPVCLPGGGRRRDGRRRDGLLYLLFS